MHATTNSSSTTDAAIAASSISPLQDDNGETQDEPLFYMDNSPPQDSPPKNSELVGGESEDDSEDEEDVDTHVDAISHCTTNANKDNSNSSLATVAGDALEKLVGLAVGIPATLASDSEDAIDSRSDDHLETEVYLEDADSDSTSTVVAQGTQEASPANAAKKIPAPAPINPNAPMDNDDTISSVPPTPSTPGRPCDINASKDILTEGQSFAYVGLCLVTANTLFQALEGSEAAHAKESLESFVSKLIGRMSRHLDIDSNTQRTIAQLPQMMIQPEDLLETFVADGTQRVVSSQQVDQSDLPSSRPSSPTLSRESMSSRMSERSSGSVTRAPSPAVPFSKSGLNQCESPIRSSFGLASEPSTPMSPRFPGSQKSITVDLRWTLIADLFLISISDCVYDARSRVLLKTIGHHLGLDWDEIVLFEKSIMKQLQSTEGILKPDTKSRNNESRKKRMIMMGLATVGGGLVLGLSAGLFAPVIGAGIGAALAGAHITGATATAASAFLAGSGGIAVITSGAAVTGSGLAMKKMARRTAGIDTFEFKSIQDNGRVNVILTISGWLDIGEEDSFIPFSTLDPVNGDHFALLWEPEMLLQLGNALGLLASEVISLTAQEILKHTLLSALLSALAWPMALTRLGYLIDNPWSNALGRAKLAGLVLADSLLMRSYLGFRPVTLVGYSLGARVIFYCLMELGRLDAYGIVENAYLFGAPITASESQWRQARSAVAGEFVNGYLRNDWVLGFLFRATTGGLGTVAGLRPIKNVPGLTNMDLTDYVEGHLDYRLKAPLLMKLMGLKITSESFLDKEEAVLHQRSLKLKPNEVLRAPKPMMPSKTELAKSEALTENEKIQLEIAFRRPAPKAKIPDLDSLKGLSPEELEGLRAAFMSLADTPTPARGHSS
ncbi:hypothetical protein B0O80DRAFT_445771 [Mortierella sp. GBAus27b]|nr:hypothetical protein BGX31_009846 [Mortierella sp. GBA43]KAI8357768.1 hypothetical protein B0O80DRAFT_445771 [Mortierella sp. GBAus27b]